MKKKSAKGNPGSGGFSQQYPISVKPGSPPPAYLRPKKGYLWDTETLCSGKERLGFFERPMCCRMEWTRDLKTAFDTNMTQAGTLRQPERFMLSGVHLSTFGADPSDLEHLLFGGKITFYFSNRRVYFESMLSNLVVAQKSPEEWRTGVLKFTKQNNILVDADGKIVDQVKKAGKKLRKGKGEGFINCCDPISKSHEKEKLSIGRYTYQIGPCELFNWEIVWPTPQILKKPVTFRVAMYGILFQPI